MPSSSHGACKLRQRPNEPPMRLTCSARREWRKTLRGAAESKLHVACLRDTQKRRGRRSAGCAARVGLGGEGGRVPTRFHRGSRASELEYCVSTVDRSGRLGSRGWACRGGRCGDAVAKAATDVLVARGGGAVMTTLMRRLTVHEVGRACGVFVVGPPWPSFEKRKRTNGRCGHRGSCIEK